MRSSTSGTVGHVIPVKATSTNCVSVHSASMRAALAASAVAAGSEVPRATTSGGAGAAHGLPLRGSGGAGGAVGDKEQAVAGGQHGLVLSTIRMSAFTAAAATALPPRGPTLVMARDDRALCQSACFDSEAPT